MKRKSAKSAFGKSSFKKIKRNSSLRRRNRQIEAGDLIGYEQDREDKKSGNSDPF